MIISFTLSLVKFSTFLINTLLNFSFTGEYGNLTEKGFLFYEDVLSTKQKVAVIQLHKTKWGLWWILTHIKIIHRTLYDTLLHMILIFLRCCRLSTWCDFVFNHIQDRPFQGHSLMGGGGEAPSLKSVICILQWWNLAHLYLNWKRSKKFTSHVIHLLSSADISIFSPEINNFCYIKKYATGTRHSLENLHQYGKRVKIKSQKVFGATSYVCRSYRGKTGRGVVFQLQLLETGMFICF